MSALEVVAPTASRWRADLDDALIAGLVVAGVAHLVAVPDHLTWWATSGVFFAALGVVQLAIAARIAMRTLSPRLAAATLAATVAVILVYVMSRTVGIPGTPPVPAHGDRWVPGRAIVANGDKVVGPLDLITLVAELVSGAVLFVRLAPQARRRAANVLGGLGALLWGGALTGLL